jgi:hypothetical protein
LPGTSGERVFRENIEVPAGVELLFYGDNMELEAGEPGKPTFNVSAGASATVMGLTINQRSSLTAPAARCYQGHFTLIDATTTAGTFGLVASECLELVVNRSRIIGNRTSGLYIYQSTTAVANTLFNNNGWTDTFAGAVHALANQGDTAPKSTRLHFNTIVGNISDASDAPNTAAGGIRCENLQGPAAQPIEAFGNIVQSNTGRFNVFDDAEGCTLAHSIVEMNSTDGTPAQLGVGPGTKTETVPLATDFSLDDAQATNIPELGELDLSTFPVRLDLDLDGAPRVVGDPDMGAQETQPQ